MHRDLKPENVLLESQDGVGLRIIDFGLSTILGPKQKSSEPVGTKGYVAPEIILERPYGKEVDLWSLGVIIYLMLSGYLPFAANENYRESIILCEVSYPGEIWDAVSPTAKDLVQNLL